MSYVLAQVSQSSSNMGILPILLLVCLVALVYSFIARSKAKKAGTLVQKDMISQNVKHYPVITTISQIFKALGFLLILVGVGGLYLFINKELVLFGILTIVISGFFSVLCYGIAEVIIVVADIAKSAMRINKQLEIMSSKEAPQP